MKHILLILTAAVLGVALFPARAVPGPDTNLGFRGWGPRVGLSLHPDQVHFGTHFDYGQFADRLRFQPNVELGFGDDVDLFTVNAEAAYRFTSMRNVWSPYMGGGVGINIKRFDDASGKDTVTDLGVNVLGGIEKGLSNSDRLFIEAKFSLNDVPDAKVTIGWTFYH